MTTATTIDCAFFLFVVLILIPNSMINAYVINHQRHGKLLAFNWKPFLCIFLYDWIYLISLHHYCATNRRLSMFQRMFPIPCTQATCKIWKCDHSEFLSFLVLGFQIFLLKIFNTNTFILGFLKFSENCFL